jgi:hypothetical protein
MEWGFDAVLLNTAVALSEDPVPWPAPFRCRQCRPRRLPAGAMAEQRAAQPSTPCWARRSGTRNKDHAMDSAEIKALAQAIVHQHSATFGARCTTMPTRSS